MGEMVVVEVQYRFESVVICFYLVITCSTEQQPAPKYGRTKIKMIFIQPHLGSGCYALRIAVI
ncbi:hypothetical protein EFS14_06870 [Lentilactobacillus buchneri]|nr:hypothetical protein [Lentilactobacillus buchneri]MCT3547489.1 hypothetical protein [Lentilactobacillus buchneri]MCT4437891.1 hypothetical protein [Lentilactobacillus buchneri]